MTFRRPTLEQLTAQTETEIRARLGIGPLLRRSVLAVLARVMAGLAHSGHGFVAWIGKQILPDTAEAEFLERHGSSAASKEYYFEPKALFEKKKCFAS